MVKDINKRPIYVELNGDKCRLMKENKAFVKPEGEKEFASKFEVGNDTFFDIFSHGKEITEKEYNSK